MKVAVFETEHFEGSYPIIRLLDNGQNNLFIFTYKISYDQFKFLFGEKMLNYEWIVKGEHQSKRNFIYLMYKIVKQQKIEKLHLNTVSNNYIFYALMIIFLRKTRVIVTIHDVNGYFEFNPPYSFRKSIRYIGKKCLLKVVNEFNVVSQTMVPYLQNKLPQGKIVHCVPGSVFEFASPLPGTDEKAGRIKIVVPGIVDRRRRNYNIVFDLLDKCNELNVPVSVVLLGGISKEYGNGVLEKCLLYSHNQTNLKFYNQPLVDQPEFDRVMNEAHFVFVPSVIKTVISDNVEEVYGMSIASGNLFDIIKHAKPFIAPALLNVDSYLEQSCFRYQKPEEILVFLRELLNNPAVFQQWQENALAASRNFTIKKVRERNNKLFG